MDDTSVTPADSASSGHLGESTGAAELRIVAGDRPEELYEAAVRLCREASGAGSVASAALRTVERFADALAETRSRDCARFAVDLAGRLLPGGPGHREESERIRRSVAAKLTKAQQLRELAPLFAELPDTADDPSTEVRACLLGELALIGAGRGRPALDAYAERLRELGHPLAVLPRTRLDIEHRFTVRVRGLGSVKTPEQLRSRFPETSPSEAGAAAGRTARPASDGARSRAAAEPFVAGGWAREPEARFFTLPRPVDPDDFDISFVKELPLACLAGEGTRRGGAVACRTAPDDVLDALFAAAYHGGANGRAQGGAYARLYAWRSLYALMDLSADVPFLEAAGRALDHRWLRFMAFTDWFHHDTADEAFAVLDPGRGRVAVLAATDTGTDGGAGVTDTATDG
ncbi:DUF6183 family protein [Streptomyces aureus]